MTSWSIYRCKNEKGGSVDMLIRSLDIGHLVHRSVFFLDMQVLELLTKLGSTDNKKRIIFILSFMRILTQLFVK